MDSNLDKFKDAFEAVAKADPQPTTVAIVVHENPDPDCIGSAVGMQKLLKHFVSDVKCTIFYSGEISHPQNKTMMNLLNIQMTDRADAEPLTQKSAQVFIVIDTTPERCGLKDINCLLTIDHHKGDAKKCVVKDIRSVGSSSAIVWEYLNKAGVTFDKTDEDADIATALVIGIKTDTFDLSSENVSSLDFEAYRYLTGFMNQNKFAKIIKYPLPPYYFDLRSRLDQAGNTRIESGVFIGGIGYIVPSKRDALPTIADERSRVEGTDTAFIFAIVGEDRVEVSVRSNALSIDVNEIIQDIFGKERGGGKLGAGAAKIVLPFSLKDSSESIIDGLWVAIRDFYMEKILQHIRMIK